MGWQVTNVWSDTLVRMHSHVRKGSYSRADALKFPKRSMFQDINITYESLYCIFTAMLQLYDNYLIINKLNGVCCSFLLQPYCYHCYRFFLSFILYISDNHIYIVLFDTFQAMGMPVHFLFISDSICI